MTINQTTYNQTYLPSGDPKAEIKALLSEIEALVNHYTSGDFDKIERLERQILSLSSKLPKDEQATIKGTIVDILPFLKKGDSYGVQLEAN